MNPIRVICIFAFLVSTQAIAQGNPEGTCLLQKAVERGSVMSQVVSFAGASVNAHRNWRTQHKLLLTETTESMDVLEEFIEKQEESGDACSARLLEAKRALDGLLKELKTLETQIDSHEEVLETETENLNITDLAVEAVKTTHKEDMDACEKKKQEAMDRVSKYEDELEELHQIAKPGVRYEHVTKIPENVSLLQHVAWTKESCVAFAQLQKKRRKHVKLAKHASKSAADPEEDNNNANNDDDDDDDEKKKKDDDVDCDAQREELQKAFTDAVLATRDLLKKAQDDVADTSCVDDADAKKATALVPLTAQRERAASLIESSSASLAALDPIMDLVDTRVEKLSNHIYDVLTPECAEAKEVSEALEKIRELIQMLEECPGRNNFKLKIPPTEAQADAEDVTCVPYSLERCKEVAKALGLEIGGAGHSFAGDYSNKGCYAYNSDAYKSSFEGVAYYGTGGSKSQMAKQKLTGGRYRPEGYDSCPTEEPSTEADTPVTNEDLGVDEDSAEVTTNQSLLANSTKDSEDSNEGKTMPAAMMGSLGDDDDNNINTTA